MGIDSGYGVGSLKTGVCTSTTRPASPFEGQTIYETDTDLVKSYNGASWVTIGPATADALVRVGGGALSGAATTFSSVFSATYDAYQIVLSNLVGSTTISLLLTFGSTTTGYYGGFIGVGNDGTLSGYGLNNAASINRGIYATTNGGSAIVNVINPFLTQRTFWNLSSKNSVTTGGSDGATGPGFVDTATSYNAFTLTTNTGTCTGTCNIYGLSLS